MTDSRLSATPTATGWPAINPRQMAAVDRAMVDTLGFDLLSIMELAGRAVAAFARDRFLGGVPRGRRVLVLAGGGGNGGDGLVAARHLLGWGATVDVRLSRPPATLGAAAARQHAILAALGQPPHPPPPDAEADPEAQIPALPPADLVVDALLGFGLAGPPTAAAARLIEAANAHPAPILAVDLPSGLDGTSGHRFSPTVVATATLTLGLPKTGLLTEAARPLVGELFVADIGIPAAAYRAVGADPGPGFATSDFVRLT